MNICSIRHIYTTSIIIVRGTRFEFKFKFKYLLVEKSDNSNAKRILWSILFYFFRYFFPSVFSVLGPFLLCDFLGYMNRVYVCFAGRQIAPEYTRDFFLVRPFFNRTLSVNFVAYSELIPYWVFGNYLFYFSRIARFI